MSLSIITQPATEPISLEQAKDHMRIEISDDDSYISNLIQAGREYAEHFTRRALITQTWELYLDDFPGTSKPIMLPKAPLQSVTSINYLDSSGNSQLLAASDYVVDANHQPGRIQPAFGKTWPGTRGIYNSVTVRFVAGYGTDESVPEDLKRGIKQWIADAYENRENAIVAPGISTSVNVTANTDRILWPYRLEVI